MDTYMIVLGRHELKYDRTITVYMFMHVTITALSISIRFSGTEMKLITS